MRLLLPPLIIAILGMTGCETAPEPVSSSHTDVSAIPWNKPASWEGTGALGGFAPQGNH
jgi:hypothetical protein